MSTSTENSKQPGRSHLDAISRAEVSKAFRDGTVFTANTLAFSDEQKHEVFHKLNFGYKSFVSTVLEQNIEDSLKKSFISMALKFSPSQMLMVPPEFQTKEMVLQFIADASIRLSIDAITRAISPNIIDDEIAQRMVTYSLDTYYTLPEKNKTKPVYDTFCEISLRTMYAASGTIKERIATAILEKPDYIDPIVAKFIIKTDRELFKKLPDRIKTEDFCRFFALNPLNLEMIKPLVGMKSYRAAIENLLNIHDYSFDPKTLLNAMSRKKDVGITTLLKQAIDHLGLETMLPHCKTARHAITMMEIFGKEALPGDMKHVRTAKRHALSNDLDI